MQASGRFLPTLDGWRAVAIAAVVASHAFTVDSGPRGGMLNLLAFRLGTFGVMLFFAISGYLICTRLSMEQERTGSISLRSFYLRRAFRIFPAAWVYLATIGVLAGMGIVAARWSDFAPAIFFYANYVPPQSWFTGHFWSLALEEHFYLFWPPLLLLLDRRKALGAAVALIAVTILLRSLAPDTDPAGYMHLRFDAFMFPCILAILLRHENISKRFTEALKPGAWLGVIAILAMGIAAGVRFPAWREPQRILQSAALPVIVATTVLRPTDWFGKILRWRALAWIGRASYSSYLWQQLVFGLAPRNLHARLAAMPLWLAGLFALAALSYRFIEQPGIAWGSHFAVRLDVD